jgi:hypothetical protein
MPRAKHVYKKGNSYILISKKGEITIKSENGILELGKQFKNIKEARFYIEKKNWPNDTKNK